MQYSRIVASKFDKDSFIGVIPETFGTSTSSIGTVELFHPYGFASRPVDMDSNGACGMVRWEDGAQGYTFLLNDGRIQSKLPEIKPGESFQYGVTGAFSRIGADGVISLFTTDDTTTTGRSVYLQIGPTGLTFSFPFGKMTFNADGFHVLHNSGARIDCGAIGGLPSPLDALSSYVSVSGAIVRLNGSAVSVGAATGVPEPSAKAIATVAALQSLATSLDAVAIALTSIGTFPGMTAPAGTQITAAVAAIGVAQSAIAASATTIPSIAMASS